MSSTNKVATKNQQRTNKVPTKYQQRTNKVPTKNQQSTNKELNQISKESTINSINEATCARGWSSAFVWDLEHKLCHITQQLKNKCRSTWTQTMQDRQHSIIFSVWNKELFVFICLQIFLSPELHTQALFIYIIHIFGLFFKYTSQHTQWTWELWRAEIRKRG